MFWAKFDVAVSTSCYLYDVYGDRDFKMGRFFLLYIPGNPKYSRMDQVKFVEDSL